jgi:hypothetical protein
LNEEKLCQLLANQTRAREKVLQQTVTARPQRVVAAQVQYQTSNLKKTAVAVVQIFVQQVQTHRASHVQRVPSSKNALQRPMAIHHLSVPTVTAMEQLVPSVLHTATVMTVRLALMTVVVVLHTATVMTVRLALVTATHALHTVTAMTAAHVAASVQHMGVQVQQQVAATVAK